MLEPIAEEVKYLTHRMWRNHASTDLELLSYRLVSLVLESSVYATLGEECSVILSSQEQCELQQ